MTHDRTKDAARTQGTKSMTALVSIAVIVILGLAVYGNSLSGKFVWDDQFLIKDNVYIKSWSNSMKIFQEDIGASGKERYSAYRPVQTLTYMVNYSLGKLDVRPYHLTNVLLHIMVALSILWLIRMLSGDALLALLTAALFVVHPIHTEAVSYISGRADPLAAVFMLLAFIAYIRYLGSQRLTAYLLVVVCYILALLSRENTLIFPILLILYHSMFKKDLRRGPFLGIVTIAAVYSVLRVTVLRSILGHVSYTTTVLQRIPGSFVAVTTYIKLLVLPLSLHMEYGKKLFTLTDPRAVAGIVIAVSLLAYALKKKDANRLSSFAILWFFLALAPSANIYPINAYMAEHWLYLPSIGFFLIVSQFICLLYKKGRLAIAAVVLVMLAISFYSYLTIRQNAYWREPKTFYERTLHYAPDSARVYNNLGLIYKDMGRTEEAIALYEKAIKMNPQLPQAYNNIGNTYRDTAQKERAIVSYKKAIDIDPKFVEPYNNLCLIYKDQRRYEEAIGVIKKALDIDPNYAESYNNLAGIYCDIGRTEEGIALFKKALEINPHIAVVYGNLGLACNAIGRRDEAIRSYKKAIELQPDYADAYNNLGIVYSSIGRKDEAILSYKKAVEINPQYAKGYYNLGLVYGEIGKTEEAIELFKKAIGADPKYALAYNNLAVAYFFRKQYQLSIESCDKAKALGFVNSELLKVLRQYRKQ